MRAAILATAILATAPALAHADDSFDARAQSAVRIRRIENLVWALTAPCDKGDDTEQRQCRHVRDTRLAELTGQTLLVDADADAFDAGAFSPQKKSVPLVVTECIRCAGVDVDGKTYFVTGTGAAPHFAGGKLEAAKLHDNARPFADAKAAGEWTRSLATARVQMLVKLPAKPRWTVDGKQGISLDVLGYRVYSPCDGSVIVGSKGAGPGEIDRKACQPTTVAVEPAADQKVVEALTPALIDEAMKPVLDQSHVCYAQSGVAGKAKLKITVAADGSVEKYEQQGDFVGTPTGTCLDEAVKKVHFVQTKRPRTSLTFPVSLP